MSARGDAEPRRRRRGVAPGLRRLVLAVAVTALAGACGGATKFDDEVTPVGDRLRTNGTVTIVAPATSGSTTLAPTTVTTRLATTTTRPAAPTTARATTTRAPAPTVNPAEQAILRAASGNPGGAAGIILQPTPARTLVVEVLEEPGAPANRGALDRVMADLRRYSAKPVSEVHTALPTGSSARRWTESELAAVADRSAKVPRGADRFVLRLVFVRGQNVRSGNILAESFRGDTFAAFPDRFGSAGQQVITSVTVHELGHL
ncbi:MAG: hypothetical protein ABIS47_11690, partial [Acidimicrobiales bacterium]